MLVAALLAACSGGDTEPTEEEATPTVAEATTTEADVATSSPDADPTASDDDAATDTPTDTAVDEAGENTTDLLDERFEFALGLLNGAPIDAATYEEVFAEQFRTQVPFDQFLPVLDQLAAIAPYALGEELERTSTDLVQEIIGTDGMSLILSLSLDQDGQIVGLLASPGEPPELDPPVESLTDAVSRLEALGAVNLAAATVTDGACAVDLGVDADTPAPIGSAFKLYVLGAVVDAIEAGDLAWSDQLTVTDEIRSLPSGQLQDAPAGEQVSVAEAATLMISISDNTATDLLMDTVGREAVEAAQSGWGHSSPELNLPFPTTRELFQLKAADPAVLDAWEAGDEAARRAILDDLAGTALPGLDLFADGPIRPDTVEWFASPADLCRVLAALHQRIGQEGMEPLAEALTTNPGVPDSEGRWSQILFKGGSEPGLVTTAFLVEDADGGVYVFAGSVVDPDTEIDTAQAVLLMAAARDLLPAS